jgi:flagellar protein FliO/FliZ
MVDLLLYVILFALIALAVLGGVWFVRNSSAGQSSMTAIFGAKPDKRLAVVEHASVDGRRRLVLVRRDNVEHLIMTGGPVDVLIETGIEPGRAEASMTRSSTSELGEGREPPVFGRQNRNGARPAQPIAE